MCSTLCPLSCCNNNKPLSLVALRTTQCEPPSLYVLNILYNLTIIIIDTVYRKQTKSYVFTLTELSPLGIRRPKCHPLSISKWSWTLYLKQCCRSLSSILPTFSWWNNNHSISVSLVTHRDEGYCWGPRVEEDFPTLQVHDNTTPNLHL